MTEYTKEEKQKIIKQVIKDRSHYQTDTNIARYIKDNYDIDISPDSITHRRHQLKISHHHPRTHKYITDDVAAFIVMNSLALTDNELSHELKEQFGLDLRPTTISNLIYALTIHNTDRSLGDEVITGFVEVRNHDINNKDEFEKERRKELAQRKEIDKTIAKKENDERIKRLWLYMKYHKDSVCDRWTNYDTFHNDICGIITKKGMTTWDGVRLQRIDLDAGYSPDNVDLCTQSEMYERRKHFRRTGRK